MLTKITFYMVSILRNLLNKSFWAWNLSYFSLSRANCCLAHLLPHFYQSVNAPCLSTNVLVTVKPFTHVTQGVSIQQTVIK